MTGTFIGGVTTENDRSYSAPKSISEYYYELKRILPNVKGCLPSNFCRGSFSLLTN